MLNEMLLNAGNPKQDKYGNMMLEHMNVGHRELAAWGFEHIRLDSCGAILDIGCGGGQNIATMLTAAPHAKIFGLDHSKASVEKSTQVNIAAVREGRAELLLGSADALPFTEGAFDAVTAFETVYYWKNIEACFRQVLRVLKDGGKFLVCNEDVDSTGYEDLQKALDMRYYRAEDLERLLRQAGFSDVRAFPHPNGRWVCAVGEK